MVMLRVEKVASCKRAFKICLLVHPLRPDDETQTQQNHKARVAFISSL